jgi:hypothetical protein
MKKSFHLYNSEKRFFDATVFDLIGGDSELEQTKALAYLFYADNTLLFDFLNLDQVKNAVQEKTGEKLLAKNITAIGISAEQYTAHDKRADIVISLGEKAGPLLALIIEAKSINRDHVNPGDLAQQMNNYLGETRFPELRGYKKLGIALTKNPMIIDGVVSVTWDHIINLLVNHAGTYTGHFNAADLCGQYIFFLSRIGGAMKFYDEEVVSLPAGETIELIEEYQVYSCRTGNKNDRFKRPLYITFREKGGFMPKLYKLETIITLNPTDPAALRGLKNSTADPDHIKRIEGYIKDYPGQRRRPFEDKDRLFFVFSTDTIDLPNKPKPAKNNAYTAHYTLKQILTEKILETKTAQKQVTKSRQQRAKGKK